VIETGRWNEEPSSSDFMLSVLNPKGLQKAKVRLLVRAHAALQSQEVTVAALLTFPDVFPQHEETVDPYRFVSAVLTVPGHRIAFFWHRRLLSEGPRSAATARFTS